MGAYSMLGSILGSPYFEKLPHYNHGIAIYFKFLNSSPVYRELSLSFLYGSVVCMSSFLNAVSPKS